MQTQETKKRPDSIPVKMLRFPVNSPLDAPEIDCSLVSHVTITEQNKERYRIDYFPAMHMYRITYTPNEGQGPPRELMLDQTGLAMIPLSQ